MYPFPLSPSFPLYAQSIRTMNGNTAYPDNCICSRITTAFPIASLVRITGKATAQGKYTSVFSLAHAIGIVVILETGDPRSLGRGWMKPWVHRAPGFGLRRAANPRFNQSSLFKSAGRDTTTRTLQTHPTVSPGGGRVSRGWFFLFPFTRFSLVRPSPNGGALEFEADRTGRPDRTTCSFDVSYIDRVAALITIREDCSNSAPLSPAQLPTADQRNTWREIAAAEEIVQDRARTDPAERIYYDHNGRWL